jgi:hypothetical protein
MPKAVKVTEGSGHDWAIDCPGARVYAGWGEKDRLWFDMDSVQAVLAGDNTRITNMFVWACTPQRDKTGSWPDYQGSNQELPKHLRDFLMGLAYTTPDDPFIDEDF